MSSKIELLAFNRGIISRLALARLDLKRLMLSAAVQVNWMPRALGSMMLRPGLQYLGALLGISKFLAFVFATDDTAQIEMSAGAMRVWVDDALVTRSSQSATITNGGFDSNLSGWTDRDEGPAVSAWVTGGYMGLTGDGSNNAIREQAVAILHTGAAHGIRIVVARGPVVLRIGSTSLGSEYVRDTKLGTGTHSIVILPTTTFYIQFRNRLKRQTLVDSALMESNGVLSLPTPYTTDLQARLRYDQSADVVYLAFKDKQQRKIERRDNGSWSIVIYEPEDGPFRIINTEPTSIASSGLNGSVNLTASDSLFRTGHVGALFAMTSTGQRVEISISAANTFSDAIRVTGIGSLRFFTMSISGTFVATVTLQMSIGDNVTWQDVAPYTAPVSRTQKDDQDNQIVYYRIGIKAGDYTSGTAVVVIDYPAGSIRGIVRVTAFTDDKHVAADVLRSLGGTAATVLWEEGAWSDERGWPTTVRLHDGRLWWVGKDYFWGSITDGFESFDPTYPGDAGTIQRSIGSGPIDATNWLMSLDRLCAGTDGSVVECRSSNFDEPLTPTNFTPKAPSTKGSARVDAVKVDDTAMFVQRSGFRLMQASYSIQTPGAQIADMNVLAPEVCEPGIVAVAVQREPDTRIHCVLADGTVAILVFDPSENVMCWVKFQTDGFVFDAVVTPGVAEDGVRYSVRRTVGGIDQFCFEKWALESEARGLAWNKIADSFLTSASANSIVLAHLIGKTAVVWAGGLDLGTFVVPGSGVVQLGATYSNIVAGLGYEGTYQSTKLAYMVPQGQSGLGAKKRIQKLGVVLADTHAQGLEYGRGFGEGEMDDLPLMEGYAPIDPEAINVQYDEVPFEFPGEWGPDSRLCLRATAPRPCTVLAAIVDMDTNPA